MKTLFLGDVSEDLAKASVAHDASAFLVNKNNMDRYITHSGSMTGYTSLGDMPKDLNMLWRVMQASDSVHYCPPPHWLDKNDESFLDIADSVKGLTEFLVIKISKYKIVYGLENIKTQPWTMKIQNQRLDDRPTLFTAGCSFTFGVGVKTDQTFGHLLSNSLQKHHVQLALSGTSLAWSADQILRSDIRKDDIVIWGLTTGYRFSAYIDNTLVRLNPPNYAKLDKKLHIVPISYVVSEDNLHKNLSGIEAVTNFCKKVGAKLYMFEITNYEEAVNKLTLHNDRFYNLADDLLFDPIQATVLRNFIDFGSDGMHPGPLQHKFWHDKLLSIINDEISKGPEEHYGLDL